MLADRPDFRLCYITNTTFICYEETSSYWSVQFFCAISLVTCNWQTGRTMVSFVKTTESQEVSLVIISRHHNQTRFANISYEVWVTIWIVHLPERTKTVGPNYCIGPDCAGHA